MSIHSNDEEIKEIIQRFDFTTEEIDAILGGVVSQDLFQKFKRGRKIIHIEGLYDTLVQEAHDKKEEIISLFTNDLGVSVEHAEKTIGMLSKYLLEEKDFGLCSLCFELLGDDTTRHGFGGIICEKCGRVICDDCHAPRINIIENEALKEFGNPTDDQLNEFFKSRQNICERCA